MAKKLSPQLLRGLFISVFLIADFYIIQINSLCYAQSKKMNHAVIYGGIPDSQLDLIAKNYDILVVGKIKQYQLERIKQLNPKITILKYQHSLGMQTSYSDWNEVNNKEAWFAHDKISGKRMVQNRYGWYLMDFTNSQWRDHLASKIGGATDELYDGVFLDDFWVNYVAKFCIEGSDDIASPGDKIISEWNNNMLLFLTQLRKVYPKLIFINGASKSYISHVDGCMAESFVHSSWNSDSFFNNPSGYFRSLAQIVNLGKYGKIILAQSGTKNDGKGNIMDIFSYCYASYLLVYDNTTSFYFIPHESYYFKDFTYYPSSSLGAPKGNFYTYYEDSMPPNLVPNGDFEQGFQGWGITGTPFKSTISSGYAVTFKGDETGRDLITSALIPISPNSKYIISALCQSESNIQGSDGYKKLGVHFNYLNADKQYIGSGDLKFDEGQYDWLPFEAETISPAGAAFIKIRVGFQGDGKGKGSVTDITLRFATAAAKILRRDFEFGSVIVNYGAKDYISDNQIIKAHQGLILENRSSKYPKKLNISR